MLIRMHSPLCLTAILNVLLPFACIYSLNFQSFSFLIRYHLKDVIVGKIYFLLVRIKIKHMEIAIIKRETTGSGPVNVFTENETIAKYEIMDGAPVKGINISFQPF